MCVHRRVVDLVSSAPSGHLQGVQTPLSLSLSLSNSEEMTNDEVTSPPPSSSPLSPPHVDSNQPKTDGAGFVSQNNNKTFMTFTIKEPGEEPAICLGARDAHLNRTDDGQTDTHAQIVVLASYRILLLSLMVMCGRDVSCNHSSQWPNVLKDVK